MECARCGAALPAGARFCPGCGAAQVGPTGGDERKLVSVLFVDLVGSTAHADGRDPEDVRARNQLYFEEARRRIERHGGLVEKFIGDAVMALFGAPRASAEDAERAVRAALSVIEGMRELNASNPGLDLEVRAAVCTGEAVVAIHPAPGEPLATGDVVNTAARLQAAAPPGGLVVGPRTRELVRHAFRLEALPAVEARGKREPVPAWLVAGPLREPGFRPVSTSPLVGRNHELELLRSVWRRSVETARPHLVSVVGPAGIGKTRLAREFSEWAEAEGGRTLWGRCLPYEERSPYHAAAAVLRGVAGIFETDPAEVARAKLEATVASFVPEPEAGDVVRLLSVVLGLGLDHPPDEPIHLRFAVRTLLERLAAERPLLVVFEDLHWADDPLLELIGYLVGHARDARLVFLALARPELLDRERTGGVGMGGRTTLPLEPLTPAEGRVLASALFPGADSATLDRLVEVAEGNPLFLEELVAAQGDPVRAGEPPTSVLAAIAARIDALPPAPRTVLLQASVIGQTFWRGVLEAASGLSGVGQALEALEAQELVARRPHSQVEGDVEFAFRHALIQQVAYGTLPRATRRDLHAAVARFLEERLAGRPDLEWLLAHHWRAAQEPGRAIAHYLAAADRARDALAVDETYDLLTRALELAADDADRRRIRLLRATTLARLEDWKRAEAELTELLPELEGRDRVEALLALGRVTHWTEQTERTIEIGQRAAFLARDPELEDLEPFALAVLGSGFAMRGNPGDVERSIEVGERALRLWPDEERPAELAEHYHLLANPYYWAGRYGRALELSERAARVGGLEPTSAEFVLRGAGLRGLALAGMGRYEEALAQAEAAIATARRLGRPDSVVMNYSTGILREVFALEEARERSRIVTERLGPSEFNMPWMNARADLLSALVLLGELGAAERDWPSAWEDAQGSRAWERWLVSGRLAVVRSELELGAGRADQALTWARRSLEMARSSGRPKYEVLALTALGRALTAERLAEEGARELERAVGLADALGSPLLRWEARAALARAERAGNVGDPERHLRDAVEIIQTVTASLAPARAEGYRSAPQVAEVLQAA